MGKDDGKFPVIEAKHNPLDDFLARAIEKRIEALVGGPLTDGTHTLLETVEGRKIAIRYNTSPPVTRSQTTLSIDFGNDRAIASVVVDQADSGKWASYVNLHFVMPENLVTTDFCEVSTQYAVDSRGILSEVSSTSAIHEKAGLIKRLELETWAGMPRGFYQDMTPGVDYAATVNALLGLVEGYMVRHDTFAQGSIPSVLRFSSQEVSSQ